MKSRRKQGRNDRCACGSGRKYKECCLVRDAVETGNVATMYADNRHRKLVVTTTDMLLNQLNRDGPKIAESFHAIAAAELQEMSGLYGKVAGLLGPDIFGGDHEDRRFRPTCSRLMFDAVTTFTGCVELARRGFRRQFASLSRDLVETLAVILTILVDVAAVEAFHEGKLNAPKAVSKAKAILPPFGMVYGFLSNNFVHVGSFHSNFTPIVDYKPGAEDTVFVINLLKFEIWLIYAVAELAFFDRVLDPRLWRQVGGNAFVFDPTEEGQRWMADFLGACEEAFEGEQAEEAVVEG